MGSFSMMLNGFRSLSRDVRGRKKHRTGGPAFRTMRERGLRVEQLEDRRLLSITGAGDDWTFSGVEDTTDAELITAIELACDADVISLQYDLPSLMMQTSEEDATEDGWIVAEAVMPGTYQSVEEGLPALPVIPVEIAIPYGSVVSDIGVVSEGLVTLSGSYAIEEVGQSLAIDPIDGSSVNDPEDEGGDGEGDVYPDSLFEVVGTQWRRGVEILRVNLSPVEYVAATGEVSYYSTLTLNVDLADAGIQDSSDAQTVVYRPDEIRSLDAEVANPSALTTYIEDTANLNLATLGICDPSDSYQYVAITNQAMVDATTDYTINDLIAQKQASGMSATLVTVEDIYANYSGVDQAEQVRNFIIDAYTYWETDFVLLGGDSSILPYRSLWVDMDMSSSEQSVPSDLYYQCLDGTFNNDGDSYWGEPNDGPGGSDIDFSAEVYVGRASAENETEMANWVYKTLAYNDTASDPYRLSAMMVGEHLGFGGVSEYATDSMEEIRLGSSNHGYTTAGFADEPDFTTATLYDSSSYTWSASTLENYFNSDNYGIYNHLGHANTSYVMKLYNSDADSLTNDNFFFVYSQGCYPGNFPSNAIAEHFTTSTRSGAAAVIFNSRYGWGKSNSTDGASQRPNREFWDALFGEDLNQLGVMNADSHEDVLWGISEEIMRYVIFETNLFGDPAAQMVSLSMTVTGTSPAAGSTVVVPQADFVVSFSEAYSAASVEAADFQVNGIGADSFSLMDAQNITFHYTTSPVTTEGEQQMNIAAGAILRASDDDPMLAWSGTFRYDSNVLGVVSTTPVDGAVVASPFNYLEVNFNEAVDPASIGTDDLVLSQGAVVAVAMVDADTVGYTLDGINSEGIVTVDLAAGAVTDTYGNPGVSYSGSFSVDFGTIAFPVPLAAQEPLGAMVYSGIASGTISPGSDVDSFTIDLEAGQTLTALVRPDAGLHPTIEVTGPSLVSVWPAASPGVGVDLIVQTIAVDTAGTYTVAVGSVGETSGAFKLELTLNAAIEEESHGGVDNDSMANAQDISSSFIALGEGMAERGAVVGDLPGFSSTTTWSISASNRVDAVTDSLRGMVYITTTAGNVLRYDLSSSTFQTPFSLGGSLRGAAISPDQNTLVVADDDFCWIHVIDLETGTSRQISFGSSYGEGGTYSVAFIDNNTVLVSSEYEGSGWVPLRKVNLDAGTAETISSVRQRSMLSASADHSVIAYEESNISSGEFGRYRVSDGTFMESGTGHFGFEIAVSRNGQQYAVPTYRGTYIYDASFNKIDEIGIYADEGPIGVVYSPVSDEVYFAWYDYDHTHPCIDVYDTNTLTQISVIDSSSAFSWCGNHAFQSGRLQISVDGTYLSSTVSGGVNVYVVTPIAPKEDWYSFSLVGGESSTIALNAAETNATVELYNAAGTLLATGATASNMTSVISDFVATMDGMYYARVVGNNTQYELVVTKNADFNTELNNSFDTAQNFGDSQGVLGYVDGVGVDTVTLDIVDSGWWKINGSHTSTNDNYAVGYFASSGSMIRNYFVFDLTSVDQPITSAQLHLWNPSSGFTSPNTTEVYYLYNVSTSISTLMASGSGNVAVYDDLGSGTLLGVYTASSADNGQIIDVLLNSEGIDYLNANRGGQVAVGGTLTDVLGTTDQHVFSWTGEASDTRQLELGIGGGSDWYAIDVAAAGEVVSLTTYTPSGGEGEFVNDLIPQIELYDPSGTLVASGTVGADGRNQTLSYTTLTSGLYRVCVKAENSANGEYYLSRTTPLTIAVPTDLAESDGTATGMVDLLVPLDTDLVVNLVSSNPTRLSVPASVTISAGQTSVPLPITILDDALLQGPEEVTITATATGHADSDSTVLLHDDETAVLTVTLPGSATEGDGILTNAGTITSSAAPVKDVVIQLTSGDMSEVTVPLSVVLPAGQTTVDFDLTILDDTLIDDTQTVTITAAVDNWTTGSAGIDVLDVDRTLTVTLPAEAWESEGVLSGVGTLEIGGTLQTDLVVSLISDDTSEFEVPSEITIPAGQTTVTFDVTIVDDADRDGAQPVLVTASNLGFSDETDTITIHDNESDHFVWNAIGNPQTAAIPFGVTVLAKNVDDETIVVYNETVSLTGTGDSGSVAISPENLTFVNGEWASNIAVNAVDTNVVLILDDSTGTTGQSNAFDVVPGPLAGFEWSTIDSMQYENALFEVTVTAVDANGFTVTDCNDTVDLSGLVYEGTSSTVVISEIEVGATDRMEFTNVSGVDLDISNWKVLVYDSANPAAPQQVLEIPAGTICPAGEVFVLEELGDTAGAYPHYYSGTNLNWTPFSTTGVLLLDSAGSVRDFVGASTLDPSSIVTPVTMVPYHWQGSQVSGVANETLSYQRVGNTDNNNESDWVVDRLPDVGTLNTGLATEFTEGIVAIDPVTATLVDGQWTGGITVLLAVNQMYLHLDDNAGHVQDSNTFDVLAPAVLITISGDATEGDGQIIGTIDITSPSSTDLVVNLTSSVPGRVGVPSTVTIPAGQTTVDLPIAIVDNSLLDGPEAVSITASANGYVDAISTIKVHDNETAALVVSLPASVTEGDGVLTGTIMSTAAPTQDIVVQLTSSDTSEVTVPETVILPAGQMMVTFDFTVEEDAIIDDGQIVTITAMVDNWTDGVGATIVYDNDRTLAVTLPTEAWESEGVLSGVGMVEIGGTLPTDLEVVLVSGDVSELDVPVTVIIPSGQTTAMFDVTIVDDVDHDGVQAATLTASSFGFSDATASIDVYDDEVEQFVWGVIDGPQADAMPFAVTVSAKNIDGATIAVYNNTASLNATGDNGAAPITPGSCVFTAGVWTGNVQIDTVDTNVVLTVDDGSGGIGISNAFDVMPGAVATFEWSTIDSPQYANGVIPVTLTAKDINGFTVTHFNDTVDLSGWSGIQSFAEILVDYGDYGPTPTLGGTWNVLSYFNTYSLLDSTGAESGIDISFVIPSSPYNSLDLGATWPAGDSGWVDADATYDTFFFNMNGPAAQIVFSGLDLEQTYSIEHVAAFNSTTANHLGNYTIFGSYGDSDPNGSSFDAVSDGWADGSILCWENVSPNSEGEIVLEMIDLRNSVFASATHLRFGNPVSPVPITPTTATFVDGIWTGGVTVLDMATDMYLQVDNGEGLVVQSNAFDVLPMTLDLAVAADVAEDAGTVTGTISLPAAMGTDLVIDLVSSNEGRAAVPNSVTIPAGQTSATFDVTIIDNALLDGVEDIMISAVSGTLVDDAILTIHDDETASMAVALPVSANEGDGVLVGMGIIEATTAPTCNIVIHLTSSDTSEVQVPETVILPAGQTSTTFDVTIVDDTIIDDGQMATITATVENWTDGVTNIVVFDNDRTLVVTMPTDSWEGAGMLTGQGTVEIVSPLSADLLVSLVSDDTSELEVPPTVTILAGQTTAMFDVTILDDTDKDGMQAVTVSVSEGSFTDGTATMVVHDDELDHFAWNTIGDPQTASVPFAAIVEAENVDGETILTYAGTTTLTGLGDGGSVPVAPADCTFVDGIWSSDVTVDAIDTNVVLSIDDGSGVPGASNAFEVTHGALDHFEWSTIGSTQYVDTPFSVTLTAVDANGYTVTDFAEAVDLNGWLGTESVDTVEILSYVRYADVSQEYSNTLHAISSYFVDYNETSTTITDPGDLEALLVGKDVFLVPEQENADTSILDDLGNSWASVLTDYVTNGGMIIVCSHARNEHLIVHNSGLMEVHTSGYGSSVSVTKTIDTVLNEDVSVPFNAPYVHKYTTTTNGEVSLQTASGEYPIVLSRDTGAGHVIVIGTDYHTLGSGMDRIIANAVQWAQSNLVPVSITPTVTGVFVNGVWTGDVTVLEEATDMYLQVDDGAECSGQSNLFNVLPALRDYGDAPSPYPVLKADSGASHEIVEGFYLGSSVDIETDGQPSADATLDDTTGTPDDEDGVVFATPLYLDMDAIIEVTTSAAGKLDAWIDFNDDGDWDDAGEKIFDNVALAVGVNTLTVTVPATATLTDQTFARFRLSSAGGLAPTGAAADGEVEDYAVTIEFGSPVLDSEPATTMGVENTITWSGVPGADAYYAECDNDADFSSPEANSGWISDTSYTFTGLTDGVTYYYRVKARSETPGATGSWTQTDQADFSADVLDNTDANSQAGDVVLMGGTGDLITGIISNPSFESGYNPSSGNINTEMTNWTRDYSGNLGQYQRSNLSWKTDGSYVAEFYTIYSMGVSVGDYNRISQTIDLTLVSEIWFDCFVRDGEHTTARVLIDDALWWERDVVGTYEDQVLDVSSLTGTHTLAIEEYVDVAASSTSSEWILWDNLRTYALSGYVSTGTVTSPAISRSMLDCWSTLTFNDTLPLDTMVTVDVLPATGNTAIPGYTGVASGTDLSGITETSIRLRANLSTSDSLVTPVLHDWSVSWQEVSTYVESPWSNVVSSTQDAAGPTIEGVYVKGTDWSGDFLNWLDVEDLGHPAVPGMGYQIPVGAGQSETLAWGNVDVVTIDFSEEVVVMQEDLAIYGINVSQYDISDFQYDPIMHTATWKLTEPLDTDRITVELSDTVTDSIGNALDGEWEDGVSMFSSGNGTPGGDFHFGINVLPADANGDGAVTVGDASILGAHWGNTAAYWRVGDFTGDCVVGSDDERVLSRHMGAVLPVVPQVQMPGDANGDGFVNDDDAQIVADHWGMTDAEWSDGDFNRDGSVNSIDAAIMAANWTPEISLEAESEPVETVVLTKPQIFLATPMVGPMQASNSTVARRLITPSITEIENITCTSQGGLAVDVSSVESDIDARDVVFTEVSDLEVDHRELQRQQLAWLYAEHQRERASKTDKTQAYSELAVDLVLGSNEQL